MCNHKFLSTSKWANAKKPKDYDRLRLKDFLVVFGIFHHQKLQFHTPHLIMELVLIPILGKFYT